MPSNLHNMENRQQHRELQFIMIRAWQQSGQSQLAFCKKNNIAYHVFHYWYKVFRRQHTTAEAGFVSLNIAASLQANVEILFADGKRIVFHQPVSADYLKAVIA